MNMNRDLDNKDAYSSYLLRIWRYEKNKGSITSKGILWRVSLESTQTRDRINFSSLEAMFIFLKGQFTELDETTYKPERNQ